MEPSPNEINSDQDEDATINQEHKQRNSEIISVATPEINLQDPRHHGAEEGLSMDDQNSTP